MRVPTTRIPTAEIMDFVEQLREYFEWGLTRLASRLLRCYVRASIA
jgi:hypothetical protein